MITFQILGRVRSAVGAVTGTLPGQVVVLALTGATVLLTARGVVRTAHLFAHDSHKAFRSRRGEDNLHWRVAACASYAAGSAQAGAAAAPRCAPLRWGAPARTPVGAWASEVLGQGD